MIRNALVLPHCLSITRILSVWAPVVGALSGPMATSAQTRNAVTAFEHVAVIPMDHERVLTDQTIVVQGGRIRALGPADRVRVPAGATRVDGRGKFLIPGLADMHAHINGDEASLSIYLANGVTTVRDMFGRPATRVIQRRLADGELLGPRLYTVRFDQECPSSETLEACLAAGKAAGDLMIKVRWDSRPRFDSVIAIARQLGMPVGGHVSPAVGLEPSLQVPYVSLEHLWGYFEFLAGTRPSIGFDLAWGGGAVGDTAMAIVDTAAWMRPGWMDRQKLRQVVEMTRRAGTWNVPTLVVVEDQLCGYGKVESSPWRRLMYRIYEADLQIVKALQDGGAGLLLATDIAPLGGYAIHRELELLVRAGLTPYQALATGTRNVAAYLGTSDSTGTVAVGKRADLVLLKGNPLADIRYTSDPAGVMIGGRWLGEADIAAQLDAIAPGGAVSLDSLRRQAERHAGITVNQCPVFGARRGR